MSKWPQRKESNPVFPLGEVARYLLISSCMETVEHNYRNNETGL